MGGWAAEVSFDTTERGERLAGGMQEGGALEAIHESALSEEGGNDRSRGCARESGEGGRARESEGGRAREFEEAENAAESEGGGRLCSMQADLSAGALAAALEAHALGCP